MIQYLRVEGASRGMNDFKKIINLIDKSNGIVTTKQVETIGVARKTLTRMVEEKLIERVTRGVYVSVDELEDKYFTSQAICRKGIFSNDTALYLHGFSERTPIKYTLTIPSGYNTKLLKDKRYNFFYIKKELHDLGVMTKKTAYGKEIKVYDIERTICDVIKNKDKLDIWVVTEAIKQYVKSKNKDLAKLHKYAKALNMDDKVSKYLEVLL